MKRKAISLGIILILIIAGGTVLVQAKKDSTGNGTPSGQHYNLNIIGVPHEMNENFHGGNGARIFVLRTGNTRFYVGADDHYEVIDHDATDGVCGVAGNPGLPGIVFPYEDDEWKVKIYVRLLGPKTSQIKWKSSYFDGLEYINFYSGTWDRDTKFQLKTGQLLTDGFQDILWEMNDKTDFRILQMRIYLE